jgi:hypothetical protein
MRRLTRSEALSGLAFGAFTAVALAWGWLAWVENPVETWPTGRELQHASGSVRAWLPNLPPEATEIRAVHNLDLNAAWVSFRLPPELLAELRRGSLISPARVQTWDVPPWWARMRWPAALRSPSQAHGESQYAIYASGDGRFCYAYVGTGDRVYAWTCDWAV